MKSALRHLLVVSATSLILLGAVHLIAGEPSQCHGFARFHDHDGDPATPPVAFDLACDGDCEYPKQCGGNYVIVVGGGDQVRHAFCGCVPGAIPRECHMRQYYMRDPITLEWKPIGVPFCFPQTCKAPKPPLCRMKEEEPNEWGYYRGWCECVHP